MYVEMIKKTILKGITHKSYTAMETKCMAIGIYAVHTNAGDQLRSWCVFGIFSDAKHQSTKLRSVRDRFC